MTTDTKSGPLPRAEGRACMECTDKAHSSVCDGLTVVIERERAETHGWRNLAELRDKQNHEGTLANDQLRAALAASEREREQWRGSYEWACGDAEYWKADRDRLAAEVERMRGAIVRERSTCRCGDRCGPCRLVAEFALAPPATPKDGGGDCAHAKRCLACGGPNRDRWVCPKCIGTDWAQLANAWERGHGRPDFLQEVTAFLEAQPPTPAASPGDETCIVNPPALTGAAFLPKQDETCEACRGRKGYSCDYDYCLVNQWHECTYCNGTGKRLTGAGEGRSCELLYASATSMASRSDAASVR